jgi:hypothetical protein
VRGKVASLSPTLERRCSTCNQRLELTLEDHGKLAAVGLRALPCPCNVAPRFLSFVLSSRLENLV